MGLRVSRRGLDAWNTLLGYTVAHLGVRIRRPFGDIDSLKKVPLRARSRVKEGPL